MIKITYSEPELKDIIEGIIGEKFHALCDQTIVQILEELDWPPDTISHLSILIVPHDEESMGLAYKDLTTIKLKIQDTAEENEKTLIHETLHILQPSWTEEAIEDLTQKLHRGDSNSKEIVI